jgi:DNA polymerase III subunit epsilon
MKYAIVDIETTGTSYKNGKITEVAILVHDGRQIVDEFSTLINPEQKIPYRITQLTGISNRMVERAPKFYEVAARIVEITEKCVFVAHNVSFDYNFIRQEFKTLGYDYQREKLCTVKLSRKLIPYKQSYSLTNICRELNISNLHPHRALGDARATATLFEMLLAIDPNPTELPLQGLNSSLKPEYIKTLPEMPGVYYFLDKDHNIIYIGKSKNIRSRVIAHLTNCTTKRALEMKIKLAVIDYELTGSELIALLLESHEIHKHKPLYNRAQRRTLYNYGLYHEPDDNGYLRLSLQKIDDDHPESPVTTFNSFSSGKIFLFNLCDEYRLCQKLCGLYETKNSCFQYKLHECMGACIGEEPPDDYNKRVQQVLDRFTFARPDFLIIADGRNDDECAVVHVENNRYLGFGFTAKEINGYDPFEYYAGCIKRYPENKHIHSILRSWLDKNPKTMILRKGE